LVDIVDFSLPTNVTFSIARRLSEQLERGITFELPTRRISLNAIRYSKDSLTFGRFWLDNGALEALYLCRAVPWLLTAAANIVKPTATGSQIRLTASRRTRRESLSWCFASTGGILGCRYLRRITDRLRFGGELYYTGAENSGGLSLGVRWLVMDAPSHMEPAAIMHHAKPPIAEMHEAPPGQKVSPNSEPSTLSEVLESTTVRPMVGTLSVNPIMGHLQATLTSPIFHQNITSSVRYDVNMYSFDADLATGLCYTPGEGQQLRLRASWKYGFALLLGAEVGDGLCVRAGLSSGPIWERPSGIESVPNVDKRSNGPSIGLELSIES
jgi:hypothetical protein